MAWNLSARLLALAYFFHYFPVQCIPFLGQKVLMRDGVNLVADYHLPSESGQYPTIMEFTPYGRSGIATFYSEYEHWNNNGYVYISVDVRGQGDSEGEFQWFEADTNDISDVLQWIAQQPWSNQKVAMRGSSYTGTNQWFAAKSQSPYLSCITPSCSGETSALLDNVVYRSGMFHYKWALTWPTLLSDSGVNASIQPDWDSLITHKPIYTADEVVYGKPLKLYRHFLDHETVDSYWTNLEIDEEEFRQISIPTLSFTGWFDDTLPGTIAHYKGIRKYSPVPDNHYLIIGPWTHYNSPDGGYNYITGEPILSVGDMILPPYAAISGLNITTAFYNWCMKSDTNPPLSSLVTIYITGSDQWLNLPDYPPENTEVRTLYLSSTGRANGIQGDGKLVPNLPANEPEDVIIHDPLDPFKQYMKFPNGTLSAQFESFPIDISSFLNTSKALVYVTEPLLEPVTVLGDVQLRLYASTDALDADFHAIIEDVSPDGSSIKLGPRESGIARARFRNGFEQETPVEPGVPFEILFSLNDMGHTFLKDHKIRLTVTSSMYDRFFPNPGTGNSIAHNTEEPRIARNSIFHNSLQPSALLLPVYTL